MTDRKIRESAPIVEKSNPVMRFPAMEAVTVPAWAFAENVPVM